MSTMQHSEFITGEKFWSNEKWWRCTDIGKRVIVAIALDHDHDPSCSGAQSKCGRRAIKGHSGRRLAETGGTFWRTLFETERTIGETDARSQNLDAHYLRFCRDPYHPRTRSDRRSSECTSRPFASRITIRTTSGGHSMPS